MSSFHYPNYYQQQHHASNPHPLAQPQSHHGRSRRTQRSSASQQQQQNSRSYRTNGVNKVKEMTLPEPTNLVAFRQRFEAGRSFDLDDDLEFCPNLLTFDERQSVTSGSSDRSSLSSGSPDSSPLQQQIQPQHITPALSFSSAATSAYISPPSYHSTNLKLHQPSAVRSRNMAIPIVNPTTGTRIASPPSSISPGMMQASSRRGW